jgi:aspartate/methionine/tyrosine aminotransferase
MKLGWMVATGPAALSTQALERLEVIADTYLSVNTPVQLAAPALLAEAPRFQHHLRNRIRENLSALDRQLAQQSLCSRLEIEAGWYAILRLPRLHSDTEFAVSLLQEAAVLVHPGHFYDFGAEGFMVVSLIPPPAQFAEGVRRLLACAAGPALQ